MKKVFSQITETIHSDFKENILKIAIVLSLLATVYIFTENIFVAFIVAAIATVLLLGWDGRLFFGFGLLFLLFCPFLLGSGEKSLAEDMAVYAYYMLALGVLMQVIEHGRESLAHRKQLKQKRIMTQGFWTKKNLLLFSLGFALLTVIISTSSFYFFYSQMKQELISNKKMMSDLVSQKTTDVGEKKSESVVEAPNIVTPPSLSNNTAGDWETVQVTLYNDTGHENVTKDVFDKFKKLGVLNVSSVTSTGSASENTLIEYCSSCVNVAHELLSVLQNPDNLALVETPELSNEIVVRLGSDQYVSSESAQVSTVDPTPAL